MKKLQRFEYLENEINFLDEIKHFSQFLKGYHFVKNKYFIKNSGHKLLNIKLVSPYMSHFSNNLSCNLIFFANDTSIFTVVIMQIFFHKKVT